MKAKAIAILTEFVGEFQERKSKVTNEILEQFMRFDVPLPWALANKQLPNGVIDRSVQKPQKEQKKQKKKKNDASKKQSDLENIGQKLSEQ